MTANFDHGESASVLSAHPPMSFSDFSDLVQIGHLRRQRVPNSAHAKAGANFEHDGLFGSATRGQIFFARGGLCEKKSFVDAL
jgi:hypothetical protein